MDINSCTISLDFLKVRKLRQERRGTEGQGSWIQESLISVSAGNGRRRHQAPRTVQPLPHHRETSAAKDPCAHFTTRELKQHFNTVQNEMIKSVSYGSPKFSFYEHLNTLSMRYLVLQGSNRQKQLGSCTYTLKTVFKCFMVMWAY